MPDIALNTSDTWIYHMRNGSFDEAWKFSDAILKSGINRDYNNLPRHFQCIWDGSPLNEKRVMIRCYHGLGDTIQFIRYVSLVKEIASQVIVWAQPVLLKLLKSVEGIDELLPLHDDIPEVTFDVDVEIMELPHIFRTTLTSIPDKVPYLHVQPIPIKTDKEQFTAGIVWEAGDWDPSRNVPFQFLLPLFKISGINIFILQANAVNAGWEKGFGIHPGEFNIYDYACIIAGLDLLITVDSMPAHLAGALNIPVWVLLQIQADWRWMEKRDDSPWYPSMRLFRQEKQGNWEDVIEKIVNELKYTIRNN